MCLICIHFACFGVLFALFCVLFVIYAYFDLDVVWWILFCFDEVYLIGSVSLLRCIYFINVLDYWFIVRLL